MGKDKHKHDEKGLFSHHGHGGYHPGAYPPPPGGYPPAGGYPPHGYPPQGYPPAGYPPGASHSGKVPKIILYFMICNVVGVCCNVMFVFFNM